MQQPKGHVPYASYLRVYEPLAAFPEAERAYWDRYARLGTAPTAQDELRRSLADLLPVPPVPVPVRESGDAFVARIDDVVYVCPWRTRLRGWLALAELEGRETGTGLLPPAVLDAALPRVVREEATADHERWRERNPDARPWVRTATWHVPVRWFVLFADEERAYEEGVSLVYRTPMVQARRRVARALKVLRDHSEEGPLTEGLLDVGRWLEEFHPRSLVELDYGGLVGTLPHEHFEADHSAADVAAGMAALRTDDAEAVDEAYARLAERWRAVRERQFSS